VALGSDLAARVWHPTLGCQVAALQERVYDELASCQVAVRGGMPLQAMCGLRACAAPCAAAIAAGRARAADPWETLSFPPWHSGDPLQDARMAGCQIAAATEQTCHHQSSISVFKLNTRVQLSSCRRPSDCRCCSAV
jgi:hypothetical protein